MYSAVLMLALTAGSETADFGRGRGCSGAAASSCAPCGQVAYTCGSSYGSSYGCSSSGHGGHGGLFNRGGHGCSSNVSYGCSSSGRGGLFSGGLFHRGGGSGCSCGPVYTGTCGSGYSGYSGACSGGMIVPSGCATPVIVDPKMKSMPKSEKLPAPAPKDDKKINAPATIIVNLPTDARLTIDGASTSSTSDRRTLVTPTLEFGATYVYTMRAEIVRDGRSEVQTQQVTVRGGEVSNVQFSFASGVASR